MLNRVRGQDPSVILGTLSSNGRVFLINPNGILFGRDSRVDVQGLTASTLALSDADFLAGRQRYSAAARAKIARNRARDEANMKTLAQEGWRALVVWECELKDEAALCRKLAAFVADQGILMSNE